MANDAGLSTLRWAWYGARGRASRHACNCWVAAGGRLPTLFAIARRELFASTSATWPRAQAVERGACCTLLRHTTAFPHCLRDTLTLYLYQLNRCLFFAATAPPYLGR